MTTKTNGASCDMWHARKEGLRELFAKHCLDDSEKIEEAFALFRSPPRRWRAKWGKVALLKEWRRYERKLAKRRSKLQSLDPDIRAYVDLRKIEAQEQRTRAAITHLESDRNELIREASQDGIAYDPDEIFQKGRPEDYFAFDTAKKAALAYHILTGCDPTIITRPFETDAAHAVEHKNVGPWIDFQEAVFCILGVKGKPARKARDWFKENRAL